MRQNYNYESCGEREEKGYGTVTDEEVWEVVSPSKSNTTTRTKVNRLKGKIAVKSSGGVKSS